MAARPTLLAVLVGKTYADMCDSMHGIQCSLPSTDIDYKTGVWSHEQCCQLCQQKGGCRAWSWQFSEGHCHLHTSCQKIPNAKYHSGTSDGPSPGPPTPPAPTPPSPGPPSPPSPSHGFSWIAHSRGKGACHGRAYQDSPAVVLGPNRGITLYSDHAGYKGCIFRTADRYFDLNQIKRIEVDVKTWGNDAHQWFSLWLDPAHYIQPPSTSGEIDLVENIKHVATNFAGCHESSHCHEPGWNVAGNEVNHHITLVYDSGSTRVHVYHCAHGSGTCPRSSGSDVAFIDLNHFRSPDRKYYFVADIWNSVPGKGFTFEVTNLQVLDNYDNDYFGNESASDIVV